MQHAADQVPHPRAAFRLGSAEALPVDAVVSGLDLLTAAGLTDVAGTGIEVSTVFAGFDDTAPAEEDRGALREDLRARLPTGDEGAIALTARAWAVRGRSLSSHRRS